MVNARQIVPAALIILATFAAYRPALDAAYIWDDDSYVTANPTLSAPSGLRSIWLDRGASPQYYPLVFTSFWLEHRLWGTDPRGHHAVNIALHALGAILLWRVLLHLGIPGAGLAAAIFAVHPVHVESVAWVTERKNVLSGFFYMAAALVFCRIQGWGRGGGRRYAESGPTPRWPGIASGSLLFVCALMSKTVTATFPAALLVLLWWREGKVGWRDAALVAPLLVVGAAMGLGTAWLERYHVGAQGAEWTFSFVERSLIAGRALWFYAGKLLWPRNLSFFYPLWRIDTAAAWQYAFPAGLIILAATTWLLRARIGRGPLAALLFFAGTLFPALGFVSFYPMRFSFVADHFQYLASIGLIVPFAFAITKIVRSTPSRIVAPAALTATLGVLTWQQSSIYANAQTLWTRTLERNPDAFVAHSELGLIDRRRGDLESASRHFDAALAIKSDYYEALNNRGLVRAQRGDLALAIDDYEACLEIFPAYVPALVNLGIARYRSGEPEAAIQALREAMRLAPDGPEILANLGAILAARGEIGEAAELLDRAAELGVVRPEAQRALAIALLESGRNEDAARRFEAALALNRNDSVSHNGAGVAVGRLGLAEDALLHFQSALRLDPLNAEYRANVKRARNAIERRRAARDANPKD